MLLTFRDLDWLKYYIFILLKMAFLLHDAGAAISWGRKLLSPVETTYLGNVTGEVPHVWRAYRTCRKANLHLTTV